MPLDKEQLERYEKDGLWFFPALFEPREVTALKAEQERSLTLELDSHLKAESGEFLGTTAMDRVSDRYQRLLCDERLLGYAEQLLGAPLYCHQYKIILKHPLGKLSLPWHQDYGPWLHHDGMPEPRALSIGIYLDEVTEFNGPFVYIPGSHTGGVIDFEILEVPGTTPIPSLPGRSVAAVAARYGIVAPKGTPKNIIAYWSDVFKKAAADPDFLKQMDAKGTGVEYVGPDGYRKWSNKMFKEHEKIAIKIGLWKK